MAVTIRNKAALGKVRMDGDALDAVLAERLIAPVELATRLGVTRVTIWRARRGFPIRVALAKKISRALRKPLVDLVVRGDEPAVIEDLDPGALAIAGFKNPDSGSARCWTTLTDRRVKSS
jgi:transcriptional regulator with XRE-family HTH domain